MKHITKLAFAVALPFLGAAACGNDLSGPKLDENPNLATTVRTPDQYFVAIQAATWAVQEGALAPDRGNLAPALCRSRPPVQLDRHLLVR